MASPPTSETERCIGSRRFSACEFISLANDRNKKILATELHFALMYAAARYTGHVGKNVVNIEDQDNWITHMTEQFQDMLRENMADPAL